MSIDIERLRKQKYSASEWIRGYEVVALSDDYQKQIDKLTKALASANAVVRDREQEIERLQGLLKCGYDRRDYDD